MAEDRSLLPLKMLVYGMGVMLLGGFLFLGGTLSYQAYQMQGDACRDLTLPLPDGSSADQPPRYESEHWLVTAENAEGQAVTYRFDGCGSLKQTIRVLPAQESPAD